MMAARRKRKRPSASEKYRREWVQLQDSLANRYSRYIGGVGDLIQRRSLEPKEWLSGYAGLWRDMIGDVGDWMLTRVGEPLRPTDEWVRRFTARIPKTQRIASIKIEVPEKAFRTRDKITLVTDGLSRGNRVVILDPEKGQVLIDPEEVSRGERREVRVRLSNLERLEAGTYSGIVCAKETDLTVAIVELEVR